MKGRVCGVVIVLALSACASKGALRCDGHLTPINPPTAVSAAKPSAAHASEVTP